MESFTGVPIRYHENNACGPVQGDTLAVTYEERFRCKPNDPTNTEKLSRAKRCFEGRVQHMSRKSQQRYSHDNNTSANNNHIKPVKLAFGYANDCIGKMGGDQKAFENNTVLLLQSFGLGNMIGSLKSEPMPRESDFIERPYKCPEIFCGKDVSKVKALTNDELFMYLERFPVVPEGELRELKKHLDEVSSKLKKTTTQKDKYLKHNTLLTQINIILDYLSVAHRMNLNHQRNLTQFRLNKRNTVRNTKRIYRTNYYKKLSNSFNKTRKIKQEKNSNSKISYV
jgi:hypothetical protein